MADSAQEKTEKPTPRRREEARASGQVARSADLNAAVTLLGGLLILHWWGEGMLAKLLALTRKSLGEDGHIAVDASGLGIALRDMLLDGGRLVMPFMVGVVLIALAVGYLQVGWLITLKPLTPSFDRLNPLAGLGRMFSARSFVHLIMGVLKTSVLVAVTWWTLIGRVGVLANASGLSHLDTIAVAMDMVFILALIDYVYQRYRTEKDLRMTKEEIKEEMKRMEGDQKIKSRRRQVQMQMAVQRLRGTVPQADVVVTNPTHYAVVLKYDGENMTAPKVTAKGADYLARKIRELAIEHGVPIVERPPLARALFRHVEVGQEVPAEFYKAVAEVLAYVYELAGRGYRRASAARVGLN